MEQRSVLPGYTEMQSHSLGWLNMPLGRNPCVAAVPEERLLQKPTPWTEGWSEAGVLTVTVLLSVSFPAAT